MSRPQSAAVPSGSPGLRLAVQRHTEGGYVVRPVAGAAARKVYRCPGCDQLIPAGTPHRVVWPEHDAGDRRHWHTPCWQARHRRTARPQRPGRTPASRG